MSCRSATRSWQAFRELKKMREKRLADYYASVSELDHEVGQIFETIHNRNWDDNTVVIFSSDQGLAVGGRHGLMGKQNLYEHVKPPLIIAGPGIQHGQSDALVYLYDLFPTLCNLAGWTLPPVAEGAKACCRSSTERSNYCGPGCWGLIAIVNAWSATTAGSCWPTTLAGYIPTNYSICPPTRMRFMTRRADPKVANERQHLEKLLSQARHEFDDPINFDASDAPDNPQAAGWQDRGHRRSR